MGNDLLRRAMRGPLDPAEVSARQAAARHRGLPWLSAGTVKAAPLAVVGGGQSAADHLPDLLAWPGDVLAVNGAFGWLEDAGRRPDYHLIADPLEACAGFLRPGPGVYLIADTVHRSVLDSLDGCDVRLISVEGEGETVPGGPSAMTRAPMAAALLGYTRVGLFGFDCCFDGAQHVYDQAPAEKWHAVECGGRVWRTTVPLMAQALWLAEFVAALPCDGMSIDLRGETFAAAMIRTGGQWRDCLA